MKPYISADLKQLNRESVYQLLREKRQTSKAEIAKVTGISPPTVIKIVNFFQEKGLVCESGEGLSALGRKPQMLELRKDRFSSIGVIHEGDILKVGAVNLVGEVKAVRKIKVQEPLSALMEQTLPILIENLLTDLSIGPEELLGIGIGIPGICDVKRRIILSAPLIGIAQPLDLSAQVDALARRFQKPVLVENDLNMAVMGEFAALGLGKQDDLVYLSLGTGFGAGVMLNGQLRRGRNYRCGEIGYMAFLDDYIANAENPGWLESKISLNALREKFHLAGGEEPDGAQLSGIVATISIPVALCINNIMTCFDCGNVSIGGTAFDLLGSRLFEQIREKVGKLCATEFHLFQQVAAEPGVVGASGLVTDAALKQLWAE